MNPQAISTAKMANTLLIYCSNCRKKKVSRLSSSLTIRTLPPCAIGKSPSKTDVSLVLQEGAMHETIGYHENFPKQFTSFQIENVFNHRRRLYRSTDSVFDQWFRF